MRGASRKRRRRVACHGRTLAAAALLALCVLAGAAASAVAAGGAIAGDVTNRDTTEPLAGVQVCAYSAGALEACAISEADGVYTLVGLAAGTYTVGFGTDGGGAHVFARYYEDASLSAQAQRIPVEAGQTVTGVDEALIVNPDPGDGAITGVATDAATHEPVEGIEVCAYPPVTESLSELEEFRVECATTGAGGEYVLTALAPGEYELEFGSGREGTVSYLREPYEEGSYVAVAAEQLTSGIDMQLTPAARISGTVTSVPSGDPVTGALVCADAASGFVECAASRADGSYSITGLPAGDYVVRFGDARAGYAAQYYDEADLPSTATHIALSGTESVDGIDARLRLGASISGRVTDAATGHPMGGVFVCALTVEDERVGCALSEEDGDYEIRGLPAGEWRVGFTPGSAGYAPQYWPEVVGFAGSGTITLTGGGSITGIDASIRPLAPKSETPPEKPPASTGTSPSPGGSEVLGVVSTRPATAAVALVSERLAVSGGAVSVHLQCRAAPCSGEVTLIEKVETTLRSGRHGSQTVVLARASFSLRAGGQATLHVHLTREAERRLAHARRHPVAAALSIRLEGRLALSRAVRID
jgi:hypothetical protein